MITLLVFLLALLVLLALRVPIFVALGLSSVVIWIMNIGIIKPELVMQKMFVGIDSFTLMAIPLFMLTGELMNSGGVSKRLIGFAQSVVGWIHGGLGFVVIVTCMFLAAIIGSSSACSAMVGVILIPAMVERGYGIDFSAGLVASSGSVGPLIPPSIPLLVYAVTASQSVSKLFVAGYMPGILIAVAFMIYTYLYAKKHNYPAEPKPTVNLFFKSFAKAIIPLLLPVIIMGGILSGVFTATESAIAAVLYCFIIGVFVYKELKFKDIPGVILRAAKTTGMVMMVLCTAAFLSYVLTLAEIPQAVTALVLGITKNRIIFLLLVNAMLIVVGMFLDAVCAIIILTPVFLPAAISLGVDPAFFGIIMAVNLMIGVLTPPVGMNLYVTSSIAKVDLLRLSKSVMPFIYILVGIIVLMILCPDVVMFLPNLMN